MLEAMDDRGGWRERVKDIRADGETWWWLWPSYCLESRMFANGLGDWGSIPGLVTPKTQKWCLMQPCLTLSILRYRSRVKWSHPGKRIAPFPTLHCSSYWKGILRVPLDYGRQLLLIYIYILSSTDFVSKHFSVARSTRCFRPRSKPD